MELGSLIATWLRRLPLIAVVALLSGVSAWLVLRDEPTMYEQSLSFAVRPSDRVPIESSDRVAATIDQRDSAIIQTVVGLLDSNRLPTATAGGVERTVTLRPGSAIIDVTFRGEDPGALGALARSYLAAAPPVVARLYRIYELEPLDDAGRAVAVPSTRWRVVAFAVLLGCGFGAALATLEKWIRERRRGDAPARQEYPERGVVVEASDRIDRIEAAVREGLEPGEAVVRDGPGRLVVVDEPVSAETTASRRPRRWGRPSAGS